MLASEIVRVVSANLNEGDEEPMAAFLAALPHFFVRVTALCVERREIGVLREFILRAVAAGISHLTEIAGFLGVAQSEVDAELKSMREDLFVRYESAATPIVLMEKGRLAISRNGLPSIAIREAACYFDGATRRVGQVSGELLPKRRLPSGTLVLPALPARPPRVEELDVAGVKQAMSAASSRLPRLLEVARLGRVVRTTSLFQSGHLLLRRGLHSAPTICVNGAADSELARLLGGHPALQNLKAILEKNEKQVRHQLSQLVPSLKSKGGDLSTVLRQALNRFTAWAESSDDDKRMNEEDFKRALSPLLKASHWLGGSEARVLLAGAILNAKQRLLIFAPDSSNLIDIQTLDHLRKVAQRGVKVDLYISTTDARRLAQDEGARATLQVIAIHDLPASTVWSGFCCDDEFAVVGRNTTNNSTMGRCDAFFGALLSQQPKLEQLLHEIAASPGVSITVKRTPRRIASPPKTQGPRL